MPLLQKLDGKKKIKLADFDPDDTGKVARDAGEKRLETLGKELTELQDLLYASQQTPLLIVLQGMDTAGKDGTIRSVIGYMNPQSCRVASFKVPTPAEAAHDFLWRVHAETPGKGTVAIFNRSHYEDVLVVRVHKLVPPEVWKKTLRGHQSFRGTAERQRRADFEVFSAYLQCGTERTAAGPRKRPDQSVETFGGRLERARPLGRLSDGLRGRAEQMCDVQRALVRRERQPQMVS